MSNVSSSASIKTGIAPWLAVSNGDQALAFYQAAFDAVERYRLQDDDGRVMVAHLAIEDAEFWIQHDDDISPSAGAGRIRLILTVEDPDAVFQQALTAGATEMAAVSEGHGWRTGRLVDPFGHQWEVGKPVADAQDGASANSPVENTENTETGIRLGVGADAGGHAWGAPTVAPVGRASQLSTLYELSAHVVQSVLPSVMQLDSCI